MMAEMRAVALDQIKSGASAEQVELLMVEKGLDQKTAGDVVAEVIQTRYGSGEGFGLDAAGVSDMLMGGACCLGGLVVPLMKHDASLGGGVYAISFGAVIFGSIRFFRGLMEYFDL